MFDDPASFEDIDAVGILDGRKAVGDDDTGRLEPLEALGDDLLSAIVERTGGFVEKSGSGAD